MRPVVYHQQGQLMTKLRKECFKAKIKHLIHLCFLFFQSRKMHNSFTLSNLQNKKLSSHIFTMDRYAIDFSLLSPLSKCCTNLERSDPAFFILRFKRQ